MLQKEPVTSLHIYRHISVIPYFYFTYIEATAAMRWFSVMEYFNNFCMYSYYALKSMQFKVPIPFIITFNALQIVQMIISYTITVIAYNRRDIYKLDCYMSYKNLVIGLTYYISCSYFYARYFQSTYISGKQKNKGRKIN